MKKPIIIALDTHSISHAEHIIKETKNLVWGYKIGYQLLFHNMFTDSIKNLTKTIDNVFIDLKFHDIPNTVEEAICGVSKFHNVKMFTVHASGGRNMIKSSASARSKYWPDPGSGPKVIAVTILTSFSAYTWMQTFPGSDPGVALQNFLNESINCGADGVVCSGLEVPYIKKRYPYLVVVVPGIRLEKIDDDQVRTTTPKQAFDYGADFIVVGRPVLNSEKPANMVKKIIGTL